MTPLQLISAFGDFFSTIAAIALCVLVPLIWKMYTNHLPHIYAELRSLREFIERHDRWEREKKYPQD